MRVTYVPLLKVQRELYAKPRDMARFREYLATMLGDSTGWPALAPLGLANPMAREHVAQRLDELIAAGIDESGAQAAADAERRLADVAGDVRASLVLCDDVKGGWTDRHLTEANARFEAGAATRHGWATCLLWASEPASRDVARAEVLAGVYRAAHVARHGEPRTLADAMRQEGRAAVFAGARPRGDVNRLAAVIAPHRDDERFATIFAAMYGDAAARTAGHAPLGAPDRGGFALALGEAAREGDPVNALRS